MHLETVEIIFLIASLIGLSSFLLTDVLFIRIVFVISCLVYIVAGIVFGVMWVIIVDGLYILINAVQIYFIFLERSAITINEKYKAAYKELFSVMKPREYLYLINLGQTESVEDNTKLCEENSNDPILYFLLEGKVNIYKNNNLLTQLPNNYFIGEMHFLTNNPMSATVISEGRVEYIKWTYEALQKFKEKKPQSYIKFLTVIGEDLVEKIQRNLHKALPIP